jgi:hypothetical protein
MNVEFVLVDREQTFISCLPSCGQIVCVSVFSETIMFRQVLSVYTVYNSRLFTNFYRKTTLPRFPKADLHVESRLKKMGLILPGPVK